VIEGSSRISQVQTYYFAKKLKEIANLRQAGKDIINLGIGSPDLDPPQSVRQSLINGLDSAKAHQYQSYYGLPELKAAFAGFYQEYFKVALDPTTEILPLIGSKEGIMHIAMSFLNPGDEALVPNPGYPAYKMTTLLAGGTPRFYKLEERQGWLPDLEALGQEDLTNVKLMWVNYPNMPTGAKASKELFKQLVAFGHKHNILICHDNPYAMILNEAPLSILAVDGAKETALELCSLSKGHNMAGWRVGAVSTHKDYIKSIVKFKSNMDSGMFKPLQLAAAAALKEDKSWFEKLNATYHQRRAVARSIFDYLKVNYEEDTAGLFVWGKVPDQNGRELSDKILEQAEVFITPGFIFGDQGQQYIRISLCSPVERLEEALSRIKSNL